MKRIRSRHSSCLWFQMFGVGACSFLPDGQRDRGNLSRQNCPSLPRIPGIEDRAQPRDEYCIAVSRNPLQGNVAPATL
jgi:hypothetical protein